MDREPNETIKPAKASEPSDKAAAPRESSARRDHPSPQPESTPQPATASRDRSAIKPRGRFGAMLAALVSAAVLLGLVGATEPVWWPRIAAHLPASWSNPRSLPLVADLSLRVDRLEAERTGPAERVAIAQTEEPLDSLAKRVVDVENRIEDMRQMANAAQGRASAPGASKMREIAERLARVEAETKTTNRADSWLNEMESRGARMVGAAALSEAKDMRLDTRLDALVGRLATLEKKIADDNRDTLARAAVLALGQVRDLARRGHPFAAELRTLATLLPDADANPAILALRARADAGVPTIESLKLAFDLASTDALRNEARGGETWSERAGGWARSLIVVRPQAGAMPEGRGTSAIIARAETRIKAGDLTGALADLQALGSPAADGFAAWISDVLALAAAEDGLVALETQAIARLGRP